MKKPPGSDKDKVLPFKHPPDCDCVTCEDFHPDELEEEEECCGCDDCSGDAVVGLIGITEQTLDLLATLTSYRNGTKMTEAGPILDRVERSLLRYLDTLSMDLEKASLEDMCDGEEKTDTH